MSPQKASTGDKTATQGKPPYQILKKLLALGLFFALVFMYIFFSNNLRHDADWWKTVGHSEETKAPHLVHPKVIEHALSKPANPSEDTTHLKEIRKQYNVDWREKFSKPVNGSAFIADYNVDSIVPLQDPPLDAEHKAYKFHYAPLNATTKYPGRYLSSKPMVGWVPNFMTDAECDAIVAEASKTMARSQVVPYKDAKDKSSLSEVRTSSQTWLSTDHPVTKDIVKRIFELTGFPEGSSEMMQVLRYEKGQKYDAHLDYFDPKLYGPQTTNRAVTVFLYLSTVEEGGFTQFPRADGKPPTWDFKSCIHGLKVRPVKGTIAFFYDMKPNGEYDDYSLHGGCKPVKGTKYGGTLWLRVPV